MPVPAEILRRDALEAWRAGVRAAAPAPNVESALEARTEIRTALDRTFVLATGKAAVAMMRGVGPGARGVALVLPGTDTAALPPGVRALPAGHPLPTERGLSSSRDALAVVESLGRSQRLLYLVSGGTSAMFEVPADGIEDGEIIAAYDVLLRSGLPIRDINRVRCALSRVKCGRLAAAAYPAAVTTLAVSDVEGDARETIGSGPTVPPVEGPARAAQIVRRAGLVDDLPAHVVSVLESSQASVPGPVRIDGFEVIASVSHAEDGAHELLERRGYRTRVPPVAELAGDATDLGLRLAREMEEAAASGRRTAFVLGGETTVKLPGRHGCGGRNSHLAAVIAAALAGRRGFACAVGGTDGIDGNSEAAGAVVDGDTAARAAAGGADLLQGIDRFDTAGVLAVAGAAMVTGATGTNVGDLLVATFG